MNFKPKDVIVPMGRTYPDGALRVESWDGEILTAYPDGGGFQYRFPRDKVKEFDFQVINLGKTEPVWSKALFQIDDGPAFEGYHWGKTWNGWACPLFPIESVRKIVESHHYGGEDLKLEGDCLTFTEEEYDPVKDSGTERKRNGIPLLKLYSVGNGWCWDVTEPGDEDLHERDERSDEGGS